MMSVGIDNGLNGAIVVLDDNNKQIVHKFVMPIIKGTKSRKEYDIQQIVTIFKGIIEDAKSINESIIVVLEKAQISPIAGKNSCFSMGYCFGMMQGILSSLKLSYKVVHAKTWQKEILRDMNGSDTKQRSIMFCKRMFPSEEWKIGKQSKEHDGLTDATCMAYFGLSS